MKLTITSSLDKGKEVELRPPFISIGRETDNDLLLSDNQSSRYHAKVEKDGEIWIIKDLESSNGVSLNGRKISESAPLSHKDEIGIGETVIAFIDDTVTEAVSDAGAGTDAGTATTDDSSTPSDPAQKKRVRLLAVGLITLLLILGIVIMLPKEKEKDEREVKVDPFVEIQGKPLEIFYCLEETGRDRGDQPYNAFIYQVTIKDRIMKASVRDLRDKLQQEQTCELSEAEEESLKKKLLTDDFLAEDGRRREKRDKVNRVRLMAMSGRRGNYVEYLNESETIPDCVTELINIIDHLVDEKTKVNRLPRGRAFAEAERFYISGAGLFAEKDVYPDNLYRAIKDLKACVKYLEGYDDPPEFYDRAIRQSKEAQAVFVQQIKDLMDSARFLERTDLEKAKNTYQEIMDRITDTRDDDYKFAKKKVFEIQRKLKRGTK